MKSHSLMENRDTEKCCNIWQTLAAFIFVIKGRGNGGRGTAGLGTAVPCLVNDKKL